MSFPKRHSGFNRKSKKDPWAKEYRQFLAMLQRQGGYWTPEEKSREGSVFQQYLEDREARRE